MNVMKALKAAKHVKQALKTTAAAPQARGPTHNVSGYHMRAPTVSHRCSGVSPRQGHVDAIQATCMSRPHSVERIS